MSVDLARVEDVFLEAAQLADPAGRAAYLDQACDGDEQLRLRVAALLAAHDSADGFLKPPAVDAADGLAAIGAGPQSRIGRYKLLEQIGEGGFGVVFMAEQEEPVRRRVALKIIKLGMDTRQVVARFEAERQALAMMDHPNVAKVLDGGSTDAGRPYFVMELVKGVPITGYCDEQRLSLEQRLELFVPVCRAVQHAHLKGVIHRDLKPTNVLVAEYDDRAVPKIIDFGVAKATGQRLTERTMFTEFGQVVGTVEYMSPEQAKFNQLDVDTRSDIYSLGVLLYELLTGATPFERKRLREAALDEVLRIIREEEPPIPSTRLSTRNELASIAAARRVEAKKLSGLVRGDLDWIVMKALEKDRNRRYETAGALAADIESFLRGEPVEARSPTRSYRLLKFVRRNKAGALAGAALLALMCGAVAILLVSNRRIRREMAARDRALTAQDAALTTAQEAVDRMLTQVASERFRDMPLSYPLRIALLEDAQAFYERLAEQAGASRRLREKVAELLHQHAGLLREVSDFDGAVAALNQSRDAWQALAQHDPAPPASLVQLARVESDLAFTLHRGDERLLANDAAAEAQYRRSLALSEDLERRWPGQCEPDLLDRRMLAKIAVLRGERAEALRLWNAAIKAGQEYLARRPDHLDTRIEVCWTCVHLYDALSSEPAELPAELEDALTRGLATVAPALEEEPRSMRAEDVHAGLQLRLASLRCRQGRVDEATPLFEQAIAEAEGLCEASPWTEVYWNTARWFHQEYAQRLRAAGRADAAERSLREFEAWLKEITPKLDGPDQRKQVGVTEEWIADLRRAEEP
jgi:eukaryotic-like serine/threonine-protein kinase